MFLPYYCEQTAVVSLSIIIVNKQLFIYPQKVSISRYISVAIVKNILCDKSYFRRLQNIHLINHIQLSPVVLSVVYICTMSRCWKLYLSWAGEIIHWGALPGSGAGWGWIQLSSARKHCLTTLVSIQMTSLRQIMTLHYDVASAYTNVQYFTNVLCLCPCVHETTVELSSRWSAELLQNQLNNNYCEPRRNEAVFHTQYTISWLSDQLQCLHYMLW